MATGSPQGSRSMAGAEARPLWHARAALCPVPPGRHSRFCLDSFLHFTKRFSRQRWDGAHSRLALRQENGGLRWRM